MRSRIFLSWRKFVRFILARLFKAGGKSHQSLPNFMMQWPEDLSVCPVETVRQLLAASRRLGISHSQLFFSWIVLFGL